jgi:hypothetical protein
LALFAHLWFVPFGFVIAVVSERLFHSVTPAHVEAFG